MEDRAPRHERPPSPNLAWRRLRRALRPRPSPAQLTAALLCAILGFGAALQVRHRAEADFSSMREGELLQLLDRLTDRAGEMAEENKELAAQRDTLLTARDKASAARVQAEARAEVQGMLAGSVPAHGPGIILTISDPTRSLTGIEVYRVLAELRNAGAEAMSIGGVRVTASTWVGDSSKGILVSGHALDPPYLVKAIGEAKTLEVALNIPGGVTASVRQAGGSTSVERAEDLVVDAVQSLPTPGLASPMPEDGG